MSPSKQDGFIVRYTLDPDAKPGDRGYVIVDPDSGEYYTGDPEDPKTWKAAGCGPRPNNTPFRRRQTLTFAFSSTDKNMKLAWVVAYAPLPRTRYRGDVSPFPRAVLKNRDGELLESTKSDDQGNHYYILTTDTIKNDGVFMYSMYASVIENDEPVKTYAVDPEMEVSEF